MEMSFEQATSMIKYHAEQRGEKRGEKIGEKRGVIKTAISMLKEGLEMSLIKRVTGLSETEILNAQRELTKE